MFQIPEHKPVLVPPPLHWWWPSTVLKRFGRWLHGQLPSVLQSVRFGPHMEMHGIPPQEITALLESAGAEVLAVNRHDAAGETIRSFDYIAVKRTPPAR